MANVLKRIFLNSGSGVIQIYSVTQHEGYLQNFWLPVILVLQLVFVLSGMHMTFKQKPKVDFFGNWMNKGIKVE